MLSFVERLVQAPDTITEDDVEGLRREGYDENGILHVVLGSSHFNYLNRVADGVGIPLDYESEIEAVLIAGESGHAAAASGSRPQERGDSGRIAWIDAPEQADAGAGAGAAAGAHGPVNLWRVIGGNPAARAIAQSWRAHLLNGTPALGARRRAAAALLAAGLSGCAYSARWFREAFEREGGAAGDADRLAAGETPAGASQDDRRVLDHTRRLTLAPWTTRDEHVEALRAAGLDGRAILQLTMLVAYVSFEVRVALGLGIATEARSPAPEAAERG